MSHTVEVMRDGSGYVVRAPDGTEVAHPASQDEALELAEALDADQPELPEFVIHLLVLAARDLALAKVPPVTPRTPADAERQARERARAERDAVLAMTRAAGEVLASRDHATPLG